jgi:predicted XRE-type DNA-binding protein
MTKHGHLTTGSIFDESSPERRANQKVRAKHMDGLIDYDEEHNLTQTEAAERFGVDQSRVSRLLTGKMSAFTIDALLNMCSHAGIEVEVHFPGAHAGSED